MPFGLIFFIMILAGGVGSVTGIGSGVVLLPALTFFGIDIKQAIAVSNLSVVAISVSTASGSLRRHMPNLRAGIYLELFAVLGALAGASLAVVSARRPLFFLSGAILLGSCWIALRQRKNPWQPLDRQDPFSRKLGLEGSYYDEAEKRTIAYQSGRARLGGPLMLGAGIISGLLGLGGSALSVLINDLVLGMPPKVSLTTSNLVVGVMALAGASVYLEAGLINPKLAVIAILGVPLGALFGTRLMVRLTNRSIRALFLGVLVLLGLEMILHGFRVKP